MLFGPNQESNQGVAILRSESSHGARNEGDLEDGDYRRPEENSDDVGVRQASIRDTEDFVMPPPSSEDED